MGRHRFLSLQVKLCAILSSLPLLISSQNYYVQAPGHVSQFNTVVGGGLPSLPTPLMFSSILPPSYNSQISPTQPIASYIPQPPTIVKETTFNGASNAVQKLILPIPSNHNLLSTIYNRPVQLEHPTTMQAAPTPQTTQTSHHYPIPFNHPHKETPLHISHPTIPVPKVFANNPPKYIQVLQFPKMIRPFQTLQQQVQQQALNQQLLLQQAVQQQQLQQALHQQAIQQQAVQQQTLQQQALHQQTMQQEALHQQSIQQQILQQEALRQHQQALQQDVQRPTLMTTLMPMSPPMPQLETTKVTMPPEFSYRQQQPQQQRERVHEREPVFAGPSYSIVNNERKQLVSPVIQASNPSNVIRHQDLAKIIQHVLEASKPTPTSAADIVKSIEVFHHHENGIDRIDQTNSKSMENRQSGQQLIQEPIYIDDIMALGDNSAAGSNAVYKISNHSGPVTPNSSNAEVELSELIDTFSISKLAKNSTSRNIEHTLTSGVRSRQSTAFTQNGGPGTTRSEFKGSKLGFGLENFAGASSLASHLLDGSDSGSGSSSSEEPGYNNAKPRSIGQQLKLRSFQFRDPAFNLIEKYSQPAITQTSTMVPTISYGFAHNLVNSNAQQAEVVDSATLNPLPTSDSWILITPVYPYSFDTVEGTPTVATTTNPPATTTTEFATTIPSTTTREFTTTTPSTTTEFTTTTPTTEATTTPATTTTTTTPSTTTTMETTTISTSTTTTTTPVTTTTTITTPSTTTASSTTTPTTTTTTTTPQTTTTPSTTTTPTTTTTTPTPSTTTTPTTTTTTAPTTTTTIPITTTTTTTTPSTTTTPTPTTRMTTFTPRTFWWLRTNPRTRRTTTTTTIPTTTTTVPKTTTTTTFPTTTMTSTTTEGHPRFPYSDLAASESQNVQFEKMGFPHEQYLLSLLQHSPTFRQATQQLLVQLQNPSSTTATHLVSNRRSDTATNVATDATPTDEDYVYEAEHPTSTSTPTPKPYVMMASSTLSSRTGSFSTTESNRIDNSNRDERPRELYVYEKKFGGPRKVKVGSDWARRVYNNLMTSIPSKNYYNNIMNSNLANTNMNVTNERVSDNQGMKKRRIRILLKKKTGEPKKRGFVRRIYLKVQNPE